MRQAALLLLLGLFLELLPGSPRRGAINVDLTARVTFYGDNTEFSNPFREGETLLGAFASVFVDARVSSGLVLRGGVFGNQRFGSDDSFDEARPVLALIVGSRQSHLILGTLDTFRRVRSGAEPGPDRTGPHGLLPPMQRRRWRSSGRGKRECSGCWMCRA